MLEDNPDDVEIIERVLQKGNIDFIKQCADTRSEFQQVIKQFTPDVILSDHGLPGFSSREALRLCQDVGLGAIPFILVTGTASDEYAISCLREGADDYILKSNLSRLPVAITAALKKRKLEQMKRNARHTLRKQNDELSKVNNELDSFVYSVSHNLRGPLASAMGLVNVAKTEGDLASIQEILNMMDSSFRRLDNILKDILDFARNARNEIQVEEINWFELIEDALKKVEYIQPLVHVEKIIRIGSIEHFYSDRSRLLMIITNIISNAILYCDIHQKPFVNISVTTTNTQAAIIVTDNGIGIRKDILPKVFDMFYRGTEKSLGAGLGLYITREAVTKLGGTISMVSTEASGTIVTVLLPNNQSGDVNPEKMSEMDGLS